MNDAGMQWWAEVGQYEQWLAEQDKKGSASTRNAGNQCGERFREGEDDEQKQSDRNEQQPLHTVV